MVSISCQAGHYEGGGARLSETAAILIVRGSWVIWLSSIGGLVGWSVHEGFCICYSSYGSGKVD